MRAYVSCWRRSNDMHGHTNHYETKQACWHYTGRNAHFVRFHATKHDHPGWHRTRYTQMTTIQHRVITSHISTQDLQFACECPNMFKICLASQNKHNRGCQHEITGEPLLKHFSLATMSTRKRNTGVFTRTTTGGLEATVLTITLSQFNSSLKAA